MHGIIDTLVGAELLRGSAIPHRNRLAIILVDSAFETACRAYLKHKEKIKLGDSHRHRDTLVSTMKAKLTEIDSEVWDNINFYYEEIRCDFYHQSAGKTITDTAVLDYRDTVEFVIDTAFKTKVRPQIEQQLVVAQTADLPDEEQIKPTTNFRPTDTRDKNIKVLMAVAAVSPKGVEEVNEYFKREGDSLRLKAEEFTTILARNSGSKKLFYFDREIKSWKLSKLGLSKLERTTQGDGDG